MEIISALEKKVQTITVSLLHTGGFRSHSGLAHCLVEAEPRVLPVLWKQM